MFYMQINDTYKVEIDNIRYFVYDGTCDDIPTKWVTKSKWDGRITVQYLNNRLKYTDNNGDEIFVFDVEDDQYHMLEYDKISDDEPPRNDYHNNLPAQ